MTTLAHRPATALVIIDVQNDVMFAVHERQRVVDNIVALVSRARQSGTGVIWVQHSADRELNYGSNGWKLLDELPVDRDDPVVHKRYGDAFEDTDLEDRLALLHAGRIVVAGAHTDFCVRSTLHGALVRGYDVTLVADAHTAEDLTEWGAPPPEQVIAHTNMYWDNQSAPGRAAVTVTTEEVSFDRPPDTARFVP